MKNKLIIMLKKEKLNTKAGSKNSASKQHSGSSITKYLLFGIIGITIIAYICVSIYFMKHFYPNTKIGNLDISLKTSDYVISEKTKTSKSYSLTIIDKDKTSYKIKGSDIDYTYKSTGEEKKLLKKQNSFLWPINVFKKSNYTLLSSSSYNESKLKHCINGLSLFDKSKIVEPVDAHFEQTKNGYTIVKASDGHYPLYNKIEKEIKHALDLQNPKIVLDKNYYKHPKITNDDKSVKKVIDKVDKYCSLNLTYKIGTENYKLSDADIISMLDITKSGVVSLNRNKVASFTFNLASKYNTFGRVREFKTTVGDTVKIGGGDYGWVINKNKETEHLYNALNNHKNFNCEPIYEQTGLYRAKDDIGKTYIEIDYTNQKLYYYKDGALQLQTDIVSGNISRNNGSPDGVFKIVYKQSPATLVGENYQSEVTYFMPFAYNVGIHDASWRSSFGGSIYKTNGSHGCVNVPPSVAGKLYKIVEKKTPVIAYYREHVVLTAENAKISNAFSYAAPGQMSRAQKVASGNANH
ncbi:L,D-transpeptidase family protein [Lachnobacterium bovis]|nr:L,D-transpeptidase family protein [Lachnobacterium bovis]